MIDKDRRKKLALHLRQLTTGQISNDDFEERIMNDITNGWLPEQYYRSEDCTNDDGIIQLILEYSWCLYNDTMNHKLKGKYSLTDETIKEIARYILFLHSELEYNWKYFDVINPTIRFSIKDSLKNLFSLGKFKNEIIAQRNKELELMKSEGDFEYWPFKTKKDYEKQLNKQPYLIRAE